MEKHLFQKSKTYFSLCLALFTLFLTGKTYAQKEAEKIKTYLKAHANQHPLSANDLQEMTVSSAYLSPTTGWYHIYYTQTYQSIEVYNGLLNVTLANNEVAHIGNTFVADLPSKVSSVISSKTSANLSFLPISPTSAIAKVAEKLALGGDVSATREENVSTLANGQISRGVYRNATLSNDNIPVKLYWFPHIVSNNDSTKTTVHLVWNVQIPTKDKKNIWSAQVDATTGEVLETHDQVIHCDFGTPDHLQISDLPDYSRVELPKARHDVIAADIQFFTPFAANSYRVFDYPLASPSHGTQTVVGSPYTRFAPTGTGPGATNGWHDDGTTAYTTTRGNNVWAKEDTDGNWNTEGASPISANLEFNYPYTHGTGTAPINQNAAITNLFYWSNLIHDTLWKYGFDEPSGNFQQNNMNRGGLGNDIMYAEAQDGSGTNNANFSPSVDGSKGVIQMFLWSNTGNPAYSPDSDFDNGTISHEYGHGWSIRLTGGPYIITCLQNYEQAGEGWSDYLELMLTTNWAALTPTIASANIAKGVGTYLMGQTTTGVGMREFQYSYDMANVNSEVTYAKVGSFIAPHGVGSIWATMLWDMTWEIIFQDNQIVNNIYNTTAMVGNIAALKLVNEGLRLQPCSPSFIDSRNAILKADSLLFNGRYRCAIWKAFARRGLGVNASTATSSNDKIVIEDFTTIPDQGWVFNSPTIASICSYNVFNYAATTTSTNTPPFSWTRAAVSGISNAASSGSSATINEVLINTTNNPIVVTYRFYLSISCQAPVEVRVTVNPSPVPAVANYSVCKDGMVPNGQGLAVTASYKNTVGGTFSANSSTYWRGQGNNTSTYLASPSGVGNAVYYQTHTFTPTSSGSVDIEIIVAELSSNNSYDTFLALYQTSFNPASPATNFLRGDDNSGTIPYTSKLTYNLTAGATYVLVVSPAANAATGIYQIQATTGIFSDLYSWYTGSSGGISLATANIFNPVGIAGSGIANTATVVTKTFYVGSEYFGACRSPMLFAVSPPSVGGSITGSATACTDINSSELILSGNTGLVIRWESSSDNFVNVIQIPHTNTTFNSTNVLQTTQFRAVVKSGACDAVHSGIATITRTIVSIPMATDYAICKGSIIPNGHGLIAPSIYKNTVSGTFTAGAATYWRGRGNNATTYIGALLGSGNAVYYQTHTFTPTTSGPVNIEVVEASITGAHAHNTYMTLYHTSFNPASPADNFLIGDDNSGTLPNSSKLNYNLTAGTTYVLVITPNSNNETGSYRIEATGNIFVNDYSWYNHSSGGAMLATGNVFNPVAVAGSGILDINTPVKKTFYIESADFSGCRIPATFTINANSFGGNIAGSTTLCSDINSGSLTLNGHTGSIVRWESSINNFININQLPDTTSSITYSNLTQTTQYRVVVKSGMCNSVNSSKAFLIKPSSIPVASDYPICKDGIVPIGQGLATTNTPYTNKATGTLVTSSPTYWRGEGNNIPIYVAAPSVGNSVYFQTHTFTPTTSGSVTFEVTQSFSGANKDIYMTLYQNSFDPTSPATNFLVGDDDSGTLQQAPKITYDFTAGITYVLVVCPYDNQTKGSYQVQATASIFGNPTNWYASSSGGATLGSGAVFNPVGVAGSGISTTATPVDKTFYVGYPAFGTCLAPATFTINPSSVGGSIEGSTFACTNVNSGVLSLNGHTGDVVRWESSTDNFTNITQLSNVTPTITYTNLTQATQYRAVVKSGACDAINSGIATISRTINSPIPISSSRCGEGTVTLTATGCTGGATNWYTTLSGGTTIATGTSYMPALSATTTYYVGCALDMCSSVRVPVIATLSINMAYNGNQGTGNYQASQTISSSSNVASGVNYFAGKSILLTPGFQAGGNEVFMAKIQDCP